MLPPHIPSSIPFLGHAITFGANPIHFLLEAKKKVSGVMKLAFIEISEVSIVVVPNMCILYML